MTVEEILEALRAIVDGAEGRDLTEEEAERYEQLEGQLVTARRSQQIRSRQQAYDTPVRGALPGPEPVDTRAKERAEAFDRYMRTGDQAIAAEFRDQNVGTNADGGFTVPDEFRNKLVEVMQAFGGLAPEVEEITTSTGAPMNYPTLNDTSNSGEIAAEGSAGSSGADLTFGEVTLGSFKYVAPGADNSGADPLRVSVELLQDSAFDIQSLVARKLGERIARKQAVDWVTGGGTTLPFGIAHSGLTADNTLSTQATITYQDLLDLEAELDPAYEQNARWCFSKAFWSAARGVTDGNGRPLIFDQAASGMAGAPAKQLLGYPVTIDQAFPGFGSGNHLAVLGNLREAYVIRRVRDVQLIVDPYTRAAQGQVNYTVWARADGNIQNRSAYVLLEDGV